MLVPFPQRSRVSLSAISKKVQVQELEKLLSSDLVDKLKPATVRGIHSAIRTAVDDVAILDFDEWLDIGMADIDLPSWLP